MELELCVVLSLLGLVLFTPLSEITIGAGLLLFVLLFAVQWFSLKIYQCFIYPNFLSPLRNVPGPKDHHFFIGQVLNQIAAGHPTQPFVTWMKRWPKEPFIRYYTFANTETLLVTNLEAHREVHGPNVYAFAKPGWHARMIQPIVGTGIVFAEGGEHKRQRKTLQALFSIPNLKTILPIIQKASVHMSERFDGLIKSDNGIMEVAQEYSTLTLEVMGTFALGIDMSAGGLAAEISRCYHTVFDQPILGQILIAINAYIPVRWLPLEANRRYKDANATIHRLLKGVIADRIREVTNLGLKRKGGIAEGRDLLSYMVEEKCVTDDEDKWDADNLLGQMLNFVSGGHETTAGLLTWASHVWVTHPEIQTRLRKEVQGLLQRSPVLSFSELHQLPYLDNFTNECLRYLCPAITVPREAVHDVTICNTHIPKGTQLLDIPAVVHFNPTIWGDDADEFDPDRWSRAPITDGAFDPRALAAFIQGPRMCIGRVLAVMEFKAVVVDTLGRFAFEPVAGFGPGDKLELVNPSVLLKPRAGLKVRVRRLETDELFDVRA